MFLCTQYIINSATENINVIQCNVTEHAIYIEHKVVI